MAISWPLLSSLRSLSFWCCYQLHGSGDSVPTWNSDASSFEAFVLACRWYQKSPKDTEGRQSPSGLELVMPVQNHWAPVGLEVGSPTFRWTKGPLGLITKPGQVLISDKTVFFQLRGVPKAKSIETTQKQSPSQFLGRENRASEGAGLPPSFPSKAVCWPRHKYQLCSPTIVGQFVQPGTSSPDGEP